MSIENMIREGKISPFNATQEEIERLVEISRRDFNTAVKIFDENLDWCFSIIYNSIFQISRAYMFKLGYRPSNVETHKTVFEFMKYVVKENYIEMIDYFDRVRKKRHRLTYNEIGLVSIKEVKFFLEQAKQFIFYIKKELKK